MGNAYYQGLILELRSQVPKVRGQRVCRVFSIRVYPFENDGRWPEQHIECRDQSGFFSRVGVHLQDRRHRLAFSGVFDTPWWMGRLRFSPLFRYGSSAPFNLGNGGNDRNLDDVSGDRINFTGEVNDLIWQGPRLANSDRRVPCPVLAPDYRCSGR